MALLSTRVAAGSAGLSTSRVQAAPGASAQQFFIHSYSGTTYGSYSHFRVVLVDVKLERAQVEAADDGQAEAAAAAGLLVNVHDGGRALELLVVRDEEVGLVLGHRYCLGGTGAWRLQVVAIKQGK